MLAFCLKNWRWFAYAAVALVVLWMLMLVRHWRADSLALPIVQATLDAEVSCQKDTACDKRLAQIAEDGRQAVLQAQQDAAERAQKAQVERDATAKAEADRLMATARAAAAKARAWEGRYKEAVTHDAICKAWSESKVPCPVE
jgi:regulator of protease activity HflC (stomatin/prohibitin superfamily)